MGTSVQDFKEKFAHSEGQETFQVGGRRGKGFEGKRKVCGEHLIGSQWQE